MVATNSSSPSTMVAANSQWLVPSICCTCNDNKPNISPLRKRKKKEVYFRHRYPKSSFLFPKVISYISIAIEITMYFEEKKKNHGIIREWHSHASFFLSFVPDYNNIHCS
jgi:hypothetical protein